MEYTTEYDDTNGICRVHVTGSHKRPEDSLVLQQFARGFAEERGCLRFLFDMTRAEIRGDTLDIHQAGKFPGDTDYRQARQQIALVFADVTGDHRFLENVAINRGYNVRVFSDTDQAVRWLTWKQPDV